MNEDFGRTLRKQLDFYNGPQADQFSSVQKKLDDALEKYSYAKKTTPTVKKNLKPLQDAATLSVFDKLKEWEEELEQIREKFTKKPVFQAEHGYTQGYVLCGQVHMEQLETEKKMAEIGLARTYEESGWCACTSQSRSLVCEAHSVPYAASGASSRLPCRRG